MGASWRGRGRSSRRFGGTMRMRRKREPHEPFAEPPVAVGVPASRRAVALSCVGLATLEGGGSPGGPAGAVHPPRHAAQPTSRCRPDPRRGELGWGGLDLRGGLDHAQFQTEAGRIPAAKAEESHLVPCNEVRLRAPRLSYHRRTSRSARIALSLDVRWVTPDLRVSMGDPVGSGLVGI